MKSLEIYKTNLESEMVELIQKLSAPTNLKDAMIYSLSAGGKRIRPLLLFATIKAFGQQPRLGLHTACALEMIHTYSLIHDDLPSMDDDDYRRGKLTNHKVFGEAIAVLAGDALLTYSFELIAKDSKLPAEVKIWVTELLAKCAGPEGMVGGQVADLMAENQKVALKELEYIHLHKTGKLLSFAIQAGVKIAGGTEEDIQRFQAFSEHLGLAFQISDDILDIIGDEKVIGKPVGSDDQKMKSTYPSLLTLEGAKEQLAYHINEAENLLSSTGLAIDELLYLVNLIGARDH